MSDSPFADLRGLPYYDEPSLYLNLGGPALGLGVRRLEAREHVLEDRVLHPHRAVEHAARSSAGPDVKEFFSSIAVNSFENFPIGSMKHSIYCNEDGPHHGPRDPPAQRRARVPLLRRAARGRTTSCCVEGQFDVEMEPSPAYLTQIAGPDLAGDARARRRREPARHRLPALPRRDDRGQDRRGRPDRHVRQPRLRGPRPARGRPRDLRRGLPGGPGPRHPAPRLARRTSSTTSRAASRR